MWGIRTLADLARLPAQGVEERLGPRGVRLQKLARGTLDRPLHPAIQATPYEEFADLEYPLELLGPLLFLLARFLPSLTAKVESNSLAAGAVVLELNMPHPLPYGRGSVEPGGAYASDAQGGERILRLPFPTRDVKFLLKLLEHSLDREPP